MRIADGSVCQSGRSPVPRRGSSRPRRGLWSSLRRRLPTIMVEVHPDGSAETHLHAGGQGAWIARMLAGTLSKSWCGAPAVAARAGSITLARKSLSLRVQASARGDPGHALIEVTRPTSRSADRHDGALRQRHPAQPCSRAREATQMQDGRFPVPWSAACQSWRHPRRSTSPPLRSCGRPCWMRPRTGTGRSWST
jgi:hypothetical protein